MVYVDRKMKEPPQLRAPQAQSLTRTRAQRGHVTPPSRSLAGQRAPVVPSALTSSSCLASGPRGRWRVSPSVSHAPCPHTLSRRRAPVRAAARARPPRRTPLRSHCLVSRARRSVSHVNPHVDPASHAPRPTTVSPTPLTPLTPMLPLSYICISHSWGPKFVDITCCISGRGRHRFHTSLAAENLCDNRKDDNR